jgi:hypothetical protein
MIRLFERAFATGATRVCRDLLPPFLASLNQGFSTAETQRWLDLRDRSSHADRRPAFATESDTRPVVNRMEQAAYDVLFNKASWHDPSTIRRNVFQASFGTLSPDAGMMFMRTGNTATMEFTYLDCYNSCPLLNVYGACRLPPHFLIRTSGHRAALEGDPNLSCKTVLSQMPSTPGP